MPHKLVMCYNVLVFCFLFHFYASPKKIWLNGNLHTNTSFGGWITIFLFLLSFGWKRSKSTKYGFLNFSFILLYIYKNTKIIRKSLIINQLTVRFPYLDGILYRVILNPISDTLKKKLDIFIKYPLDKI